VSTWIYTVCEGALLGVVFRWRWRLTLTWSVALCIGIASRLLVACALPDLVSSVTFDSWADFGTSVVVTVLLLTAAEPSSTPATDSQ